MTTNTTVTRQQVAENQRIEHTASLFGVSMTEQKGTK
jgi:hypothetical protein